MIKANIPCRIAFAVSSMIDSRVILATPGAEKLLGRGDMLYVPPDNPKPTRLQGAFVTDKEIANLVTYLKSTGFESDYKEEIFDMRDSVEKGVGVIGGGESDPLFDEAVQTVVSTGKASASYLQRRLSIGYSRAARLIDIMEEKGLIGPAMGSKPREILHTETQSFSESDDL